MARVNVMVSGGGTENRARVVSLLRRALVDAGATNTSLAGADLFPTESVDELADAIKGGADPACVFVSEG